MLDLIGLTNAMTDIVVNVSDRELKKLGLTKGFRNVRVDVCYDDFIDFISKKPKHTCAAGSSANVIFNAAYLGLKTGLIGTVGDDRIGREYLKSLDRFGVYSLFDIKHGRSAKCYILVTPDGEKTSVSDIGVGFKYDFSVVSRQKAKVFHTSGYELLTNADKTKEILYYMKGKGAKISFDLSDPCVIKRKGNDLTGLLDDVDILFITEAEADELLGDASLESVESLLSCSSVVAFKKGKYGSVVMSRDEKFEIPVYPVDVVNTNGAGDAFAAGFLFTYIRGFSLEECGHMGNYIASRICCRKEPHF